MKAKAKTEDQKLPKKYKNFLVDYAKLCKKHRLMILFDGEAVRIGGKEKIRNDLEVYRVLLDSMNITGNEITLDDIANKIKESPQGENTLDKVLSDLKPLFEDADNYMGAYEIAAQALCEIMGWSRS